jgi:hypothetical protein|eukprot:COSAG01_NODE_3959_length_5493_cov_44.543196_1_plen_1182_part_00
MQLHLQLTGRGRVCAAIWAVAAVAYALALAIGVVYPDLAVSQRNIPCPGRRRVQGLGSFWGAASNASSSAVGGVSNATAGAGNALNNAQSTAANAAGGAVANNFANSIAGGVGGGNGNISNPYSGMNAGQALGSAMGNVGIDPNAIPTDMNGAVAAGAGAMLGNTSVGGVNLGGLFANGTDGVGDALADAAMDAAADKLTDMFGDQPPPMNQSEAAAAGLDMLGDMLGPPPPPTSFDIKEIGVSGLMLRLLPMVGCLFVTFFGNKVSTVVRVGSVFWASVAPILVPILQKIQIERSLSVSAFMGIGGALYAGFLGSFAAVKNRSFGIMVQGVTIGYIVSSFVQGAVIGEILKAVPQAEKYVAWITMIFTMSLGFTIGKIAIQFEDIISVAATACIGAYTLLQLICSMGFSFSNNLSLFAAINGTFGCQDLTCHIVLYSIAGYAAIGTLNQVKMSRTMKKMLQDPNFAGSNAYERKLVKFNSAFAIVFTLNDIVKSEGDLHTKVEMDELKKKKEAIMLQIGTIVADISGVLLSASMFTSIVEGFAMGTFPIDDGPLMKFAGALGIIGASSMYLVKYQIQTHRLPAAERAKANARMKTHMMLSAMLMPLVFACAMFTTLTLPDTPVVIPQMRKYFELEKQPPAVQEALAKHMPKVSVALTGLLTSTVASWVISCKKLGGKLYVIMKLLSMLSWVVFSYGAGIAYLGYYMATDEMNTKFDPATSNVYTLLAVFGGFIMAVAVVGIIGMKVYYMVRFIGKQILRVFFVAVSLLLLADVVLCGFVGWYVSQIDTRIDKDWEKYSRIVLNNTEFQDINSLASRETGYSVALNITKEEFVDIITGGYRFLVAAAAVVFGVLLGASLSSLYIIRSDNPTPGRSESVFASDKDGDGVKRPLAVRLVQKLPFCALLCCMCRCCCRAPTAEELAAAEKKRLKKKHQAQKKKDKRKALAKKKREQREKKLLETARKAAEAGGEVESDPTVQFRLPFEVTDKTWETTRADLERLVEFVQEKKLSTSVELTLLLAFRKLEVATWEEVEAHPDRFEEEEEVPTGPAGMEIEAPHMKKKKRFRTRKNKKGKTVGPSDAMEAPSAAEEDAQQAAKLQEVWNHVDVDKSGFLDTMEVRKVMQDMGKTLTDEEFAAVMDEIDVDKSGELDFAEFLSWWQMQDPEAQNQLAILQNLSFDDL